MSGKFHLLEYKGFIAHYMKPASSSVSQTPALVCAVHILTLRIFLTWTKETKETKLVIDSILTYLTASISMLSTPSQLVES